jgi:hypothetical protein
MMAVNRFVPSGYISSVFIESAEEGVREGKQAPFHVSLCWDAKRALQAGTDSLAHMGNRQAVSGAGREDRAGEERTNEWRLPCWQAEGIASYNIKRVPTT